MDKTFISVSFWNGEKIVYTFTVDPPPRDKLEMESVVWCAIRSYFINNSKPIPQYVTNVEILGLEDFRWNKLYLHSSSDSIK